MGTRGHMGFHSKGKTAVMYTHYDAYPSGLGKDIAAWLKVMDKEEAIAKIAALVEVDQDVPPTEGQRLLVKGYAGLDAGSDVADWYWLLRDTQGDPQKTLDAMFYFDGELIGGEEWSYLIDFDNEVVEIGGGYHEKPVRKSTYLKYAAVDFIVSFEDMISGNVDWDFMESDPEDY